MGASSPQDPSPKESALAEEAVIVTENNVEVSTKETAKTKGINGMPVGPPTWPRARDHPQ